MDELLSLGLSSAKQVALGTNKFLTNANRSVFNENSYFNFEI